MRITFQSSEKKPGIQWNQNLVGKIKCHFEIKKATLCKVPSEKLRAFNEKCNFELVIYPTKTI